jgi:2-hydroxychromene-2-carboxylate isomerase
VRRAITFWFDFHSPWCYLAATRIGALAARHDAALRWRPLQLARLIEAIGGRRSLEENPAFVRWYKQDLQDWAAVYGLKVSYHPDFPLRPSRALRIALYGTEHGSAEALVLRVMRAYWSEAADISDLDILRKLTGEVGLDPAGAAEAALSRTYSLQLEANTREAMEMGIFGVPAFVLDGKIFFGNDRLPLLDRALGGDWLDRFSASLS